LLSPVVGTITGTTAYSASKTNPVSSHALSESPHDDISTDLQTSSPIQDAINAANDSDTVRIPEGTYTAPITIDKNITLVGGPGVVLTGETVSDGSAGITITGAAEPTISGLVIRNYTTGIQARGTHSAWRVENTTIRNTTIGVSATRSTGDWTIEGTRIVDTGRDDATTQSGIDAERSAGDWSVNRTTITQARYGVYAEESSGNWSISRANISRTDLYAVSAEAVSGHWSISTSILTQNFLSFSYRDRSVNGFESAVPGDVRGNWWGEDGYSEEDCVGNVVCTNPLQTKPDAGADSTVADSELRSINLSVETRFPAPSDPLSAQVDINASGPTGITWYMNSTARDCNAANCTFDVSYPANLSVSVSNAETSLQESTTIRASDIELSATTLDQRKPVLFNSSDTVLINVSTHRQVIQHELLSTDWTVKNAVGSETGDGNDSTTQLSVQQEGVIRSTLTYKLRDPATNQTTIITKNVSVAVERLQTETEHFEFSGLNYLYDAYGFADAQENFDVYHQRISQRITPLPETIKLRFVSDEELAEAGCGNAGACAIEPDTILLTPGYSRPWTEDGSGRTVRHEMVHLAQFEMDVGPGTEWGVLVEGHADFDSGPTPRYLLTLSEKPPLGELIRERERAQDYINGSVFVSAFYAEYGRQAFLEIMEDSDSENLESEFKSVTGDSLESFYEQWQPTDPFAGPNSLRTSLSESAIELRPMFVYQDSSLSALQPPENVSVDWDVDADGEFELSGDTVEWRPDSSGSTSITLRYQSDEYSISQTQSIEVDVQSGFAADATDPDGDGIYEDVNGDGTVNVVDVQALFTNLDRASKYSNKFDMNGDGEVNAVDVQALFNML
jgi:hypothetical protein